MKRALFAVLVLLAAIGCTANPFVIEQVNGHVYRFPQPTTAAQWQAVRDKLGVGAYVVKLNDKGEGSDDGAAAVGLRDIVLSMEPEGDGPIYAQVDGVFRKPDPSLVAQGVGLMCDPTHVTGVHCTHAWDRTGMMVARERVECEGWSAEAAHDEWHRKAHYVPYGDRIPAPGLEASWDEFVDSRRPRAAAPVDAGVEAAAPCGDITITDQGRTLAKWDGGGCNQCLVACVDTETASMASHDAGKPWLQAARIRECATRCPP